MCVAEPLSDPFSLCCCSESPELCSVHLVEAPSLLPPAWLENLQNCPELPELPELPDGLLMGEGMDLDLGFELGATSPSATSSLLPLESFSSSPLSFAAELTPEPTPQPWPEPLTEPTPQPRPEPELPHAAPVRRCRKSRPKPYARSEKRKTKPPKPECFAPGCAIACEIVPNRARGGKPLEVLEGVPVVELRREGENKVVQKNGRISQGQRPRYVAVKVAIANRGSGQVLPQVNGRPPVAFDVVSPSGAIHRSVETHYVVSGSTTLCAMFKVNVTDIAVPSHLDDLSRVQFFVLHVRVRESACDNCVASLNFGVRWRTQRRRRKKKINC